MTDTETATTEQLATRYGVKAGTVRTWAGRPEAYRLASGLGDVDG